MTEETTTTFDPNQYVLDFIESLGLDADIADTLKGIFGNVAGWSVEQLLEKAKELVALKLKGDLVALEESVYGCMTFEQKLARRKAQAELLVQMNSDNADRIESQRKWLTSVSSTLISILYMVVVRFFVPLAL